MSGSIKMLFFDSSKTHKFKLGNDHPLLDTELLETLIILTISCVSVREFSCQKSSGRSNQIGVKFVQWCIQTLWERSGKDTVNKKNVRPSAVVHIDGNVLPKDVLPQIGKALEDKIFFVYTGQIPLEHPDEIDIIEEMLVISEKLYEYKPVLLSIGVEALLPKVTPEQLRDISDYLTKPINKRHGQVVHSYINLFKACQEAIDEFQLDPPPLFSSGDIDCTAITYFNHPKQVKCIRKNRLYTNVPRCSLNSVFHFFFNKSLSEQLLFGLDWFLSQ